MSFNQFLSDRIRTAIGHKKNISEMKMFSGIGFVLKGKMLIGVWKDSMIVRLGTEEGELALRERHVKEFDITVKSMAGWIMVGAEGVGNDDEVDGWVRRAVKFVKMLPGK